MSKNNFHTIDATGQALGRLASHIALLLTGKDKRTYLRRAISGDEVVVKNADKLRLTGAKADQKEYRHYSGYPGGLKRVAASKLYRERPQEMIRRAVLRMLPINKLRSDMIKRLKFEKS